MGKTALGTNMAFMPRALTSRISPPGRKLPRGAPVLFFSLEMAAQQLSARILAEQTEIEMWKIRNGRFSESEWEKFVLTMQELSNLPLYIDDTGGISIAQIAARARRLKREKHIGVIIIDYLQLIEPSRRAENRVQEITEVTKGLKALAKELNVPIMALSQFVARGGFARRQAPGAVGFARIRLDRAGRRRGDVRLSRGILPQDPRARCRFAPTNAKWLEKCERAHRRAELLVEKHRHGATNKIELYFDDRFTRIQQPDCGELGAVRRRLGGGG